MAPAALFPDLSDAQFIDAPQIAKVAREVLDRHAEGDQRIGRLGTVRQAIGEEDITIGFLLNVKPFDPVKEEAKHDAIAKCVKAPTVWRDLTGFDAVIWIRDFWWSLLGPEARDALVVHELLHLDVSYDDAGEVALAIRKHDLEEFGDVVRHYGTILPGQADFAAQLAAGTDPAALLRELADETGTEITIEANGRKATISPKVGKAALEELNRDLDGGE